jgi:probable addiction module antidote protein
MRLRDIAETFEKDLQDPEFIKGYLEESLQDGMPTFLMALRNVVQGSKGMTEVASSTELSRESLYKTLSETGNPQFDTINKIITSLGFRISLIPFEPKKKKYMHELSKASSKP